VVEAVADMEQVLLLADLAQTVSGALRLMLLVLAVSEPQEAARLAYL